MAARPLIGAFSQDATVLAIGPSLLAIAGVCLVFDGTQGISTGILRGLGETRIPMLTNLAGHWLIGLPLGYAACFWWGWGVQGLWLGLAAGLTGGRKRAARDVEPARQEGAAGPSARRPVTLTAAARGR